jgi:hypothetical protein
MSPATFALDLTMTDDKPCVDNIDGAEDKLKCCCNLCEEAKVYHLTLNSGKVSL